MCLRNGNALQIDGDDAFAELDDISFAFKNITLKNLIVRRYAERIHTTTVLFLQLTMYRIGVSVFVTNSGGSLKKRVYRLIGTILAEWS